MTGTKRDRPELNKLLDRMTEGDTVDKLGFDERQYAYCVMPLVAEQNKMTGILLTFKDVTEHNALTLEKERKRLSDDLHDSLGNSINVISSNLEYALKNFEDTEEIRDCLKVSYARTADAFLNMQRIVDELGPIDFENNGLIWALESLFKKLKIKGVVVEFFKSIIDDATFSQRNSELPKTLILLEI